MGARPVGFTWRWRCRKPSRDWLHGFSQGLFALADAFNIELIGGDTTKGPLNICITVFGELRPGAALRRSAAQPGDDIWISGTLGDARLALAGYRRKSRWTRQRCAPPPCACTRRCRAWNWACCWPEQGIAHAAIDISDGLIGDLGHILKRQVGATLDVDALPAGAVLATRTGLRRAYTAPAATITNCASRRRPHRARPSLRGGQRGHAGHARRRIDAAAAAAGGCARAALDLQLASFDHFTS
jgi:thiamine-monophosphate kinase